MKRFLLVTSLFVVVLFSTINAVVKLPSIFSDNMVLQRDQTVNVWGWADKNEKVSVVFNEQNIKTKADKAGCWKVELSPMTYGGPYTLKIQGKHNVVTMENILVGDIWLCSGQSNMEFQVKQANNAKIEIDSANYPQIRSFNVTQEMSFVPKNDFQGKWEVCSPLTVGNFSAVAFFFARKLYRETGIPIGIINSSWGGTDIETWTSSGSFNSLPDKFKARYKNNPENVEKFLQTNAENKIQYESALKFDLGLKEEWNKTFTDISAWKTLPVPQIWMSPELVNVDGVVWVQYDLTLSATAEGKPAVIQLGKIDDNDDTWINGIKIGSTIGWDVKRIYNVSSGVLKAGLNRISVRIVDTGGGGGIYGQNEDVFLKIDNKKYTLAGNWKYKIAESNLKYNYVVNSPNSYPSLLYNAMIHPIIQFALKGVIWYQGENNAPSAYDYRTLFPNMITDWRTKWGQEFSFYWVQLTNYMAVDTKPVESDWAELREAQTMTLSLPKTGQSVIIDIGEANDIHPRNKQDVGLRLALHALNKDYGKKDIVFSGPICKSIEIQENKIHVTFDYIGSGLIADSKYGYVSGFSIAGIDKKFVWAKAYIEGNKVVVYNDQVQYPVAVRYNWANNPDGNLYSKEGLPTCPFRTDTWEGITEKE
ncbi:MAG: sialate O-acetylesterase [Paludibacter sp.]|jgi:sialate O-acetylesterase